MINEDLKLLPNDGVKQDEFGISVAISGTTALVGSSKDDDNGGNSGSVYLFDTTTGQQITKLVPNDGAMLDEFGASVAISGTTAVVGASNDDDNGPDSGSAYLFDTVTGQQIFKLLPNDGAAFEQFGASVAISGTTALVATFLPNITGSAYLFDTTSGQQIAELRPSDGTVSDQFGNSVAISGNTAIVGAVYDDQNGSRSGAAYLFDIITGQQTAKLLPNDGAVGDFFGWSVAISGNTAMVGAIFDEDNGYRSGSVYLFDATTGQQIAKILPSDGEEGDNFGSSIAISGTTAVVGANEADTDNAFDAGSAYLFDTTSGQQIAKLLPSDGQQGDSFGWSVAICGTTALVGSWLDGDNGYHSGSAYTFTTTTVSPCPPDLTNDGTLDFFDVSAFLTAYAANDPTADFNADGSFNFFDVSAFIVAYMAGCP